MDNGFQSMRTNYPFDDERWLDPFFRYVDKSGFEKDGDYCMKIYDRKEKKWMVICESDLPF